MTAPEDHIALLIDKFLEDELTPSEEQELQQYMQQSPATRVMVEELGGAQRLPGYVAFPEPIDVEYYRSRVTRQATIEKRRVRNNQAISLIKIAAALIMALLVVWLYRSKAKPADTGNLAVNQQSFLLLPDSSKLLLSNLPADTLFANGWRIRKAGNELSYSASSNSVDAALQRLFVTTGQHYLLMLPDSSRISLGDSSSINFPMPFNGQERAVAVSGQARFDVQAREGRPFKAILVADALNDHSPTLMEAEAHGTAFSIRAYANEPTQTVQLDEGYLSVRSTQDTVDLVRGQQVVRQGNSKLKKGNFTASGNAADLAAGRFLYYNTDVHTIMQHIGDWYKVKISYNSAANAKTKKITISAYSTQTLDEIIKMMAREDIQVSRTKQGVHVKVSATSS